MKKTALLLGATGLTGKILLELLLKDDYFATIKIFGRSSVKITHPKLEEHVGDMFQMDHFSKAFKGDVVFCCIGTTQAKTPDKETYKKIDYGIPLAAAQLSKENGITQFQVISAMGADATSSTFYNKTKGEMERDLIALQIKNTYIFKPSLIGGNRSEKRIGERFAQIIMGTLGFLVPKKYKMIEPETIASAMLLVSKQGFEQTKIESHQIKNIATRD